MTLANDILPGGVLNTCPLPDMDMLGKYRRDITDLATTQSAFYSPELRHQLLEVLKGLSEVDACALTLLDGIDACLSNIDVAPYRTALLKLQKPDRSKAENLAFVTLQEEIAGLLWEGVDMAKQYVSRLDATLSSLEASFIEDTRAPISRLTAQLGVSAGPVALEIRNRLAELRGALDVRQFRDGYVHELAKLIFAVNYFFENVLEGSHNVIQRADDFLRHADDLVVYLRNVRQLWRSGLSA
ncbi:MAG TPA: hypothetical protein VF682_01970 [Pseudomonas sp.]|jgi:hypothetical protein